MEEVLDDVVSDEELKKFERIYFNEVEKSEGPVSTRAQFDYAWCLVRSKYPADVRKGIIFLETLYNQNVDGRRDFLYYLTIGHIRIREYAKALKYCRAFLEIEPTNSQVQDLEAIIKKRMNKEGTIGMALTMAGVFIVGGLVSLGIAISKSKS